MKRYFLIPMLFLATAAFAGAQICALRRLTSSALTSTTAAAARPVTHRTAAHRATAPTNPATRPTGNAILWGQDVGSLYGKTIITGGVSNGVQAVTQKPCRQHGGYDA